MLFAILFYRVDKIRRDQIESLRSTFEQVIEGNNKKIEWLERDILKYEAIEKELLDSLNKAQLKKNTIKVYYEKEYEKINDASIDDHIKWFNEYMKSDYNFSNKR